VAAAAVALTASATIASATNLPNTAVRTGVGAKCNARGKCDAGLVCEHNRCVKEYVPAGDKCGGPVKCYHDASCVKGTCLKYVGAGTRCGKHTKNQCYGDASCVKGTCLTYVAAGTPCGEHTNN